MSFFTKHIRTILLIMLLLLGVGVRLYRFTNPIADWHSWRQADTAAVTWNFVHNGFDLLHPQYFDISNVQSGLDNPHGYRFVEFPLYNLVSGDLYVLFHTFTLEGWERIVTIFSSVAGSLCLFLFVRRRSSEPIAWFTLIFSLFLPFNIYYGRTILPDSSMIATMLVALFFLDTWLEGFRKKTKPNILFLILASVFLAASLLLKLYTIFYFFSFFVLIFSVLQWRALKRIDLWVCFVATCIPIVAWRLWILQYPEGIPASSWLFNGNDIRFRPAFFRWIFYERLTKLIAGYIGDITIIAGVIAMLRAKKDKWFLISFVLCALLYVFVIATGNVQHDYYQIVVMPAVAIVMGFGAMYVLTFLQKILPTRMAYGLVGVLILAGFWLSWLQVRDYFNINNIAIVRAGIAVEKITPPYAKLLAPYGGDTTLLYYTKRKGWPSFEHDLATLRTMGADYLVLVNPKPADYGIAKQYKILSETNDYILFKLQ